ncbi:MAG: DUF481 domain-containing protein [Planctomycetes bacterium]|nr:DUF481 domain-containing protein [Planctomycetota bacterium]
MKNWGIAVGLIVGIAGSGPAIADEIELVNGDRLKGHVVERTEHHIVFEHAQLGRLELPVSSVAPEPGDVALSAVQDDVDAAAANALEPKAEWKSSFELGGSAVFGNSDTQTMTIAVGSTRETERHRTELGLRYYYDASNGDRTDNKLRAGIQHDWLIPDSRWFWFASGAYDYDEFESWEHRVAGHGGVGYEWFTKEDFQLSLRAGLGAVREFNSPNTNTRPEGLLGYDLAWQITEKQSFESRLRIFPDFDDTGEYRLLGHVGWKVLLDEEMNMNLFARIEDEYQSKVGPNSKHNDLRIAVGLAFDF